MFDQMDVENEKYQIKPMNCPFHCLMYKDDMRSYRDLPIRWAELGTVYRYVYSKQRLLPTDHLISFALSQQIFSFIFPFVEPKI
jgi:hypothetical protein